MAELNGHGQPPRLADLLKEQMGQQPGREPALPAQMPTAAAAPIVSPAGTSHLGALPGALPASGETIAMLRDSVADDISDADEADPMPTEAARRERARNLVARAVSRWAVEEGRTRTPLSPEQVEAIAQSVFDLVFSAGPLQKYLDDPDVENIRVDGTTTLVGYRSKPTAQVPAVVEKPADLEDLINQLAKNSGHKERRLSPSSPMVSFRLPDGSRAEAGRLADEPYLIIRRHGAQHADMNQLQAWGTVNGALSAFLHALVLAKKNLLIVGNMGAGKTSLLRVLGRLIPSDEWITVLESDKELYLEEGYNHGSTPHVLALEARSSNGEIDASGQEIGRISVADMFPHALRTAAERVIVGEVRGDEALAMLNAMSAGGHGSMCTMHADHPNLVLPRLVTLCPGLHRDDVHELVGSAVHFVVFLKKVDQRRIGGKVHRFVSHVTEIRPGEDGRPSWQNIFAPSASDPRAQFHMNPACLDELLDVGFDRAWFTERYNGWTAPLGLVTPKLEKAS
ncbi:ATPase, T2SS/T4P/T4SS family [Streptomyces chartreusis]